MKFAMSSLSVILIFTQPCAFAAEKSVYEISPLTDAVVIGVTGLGVLIPHLFQDQLIHRRCPCNPGEVNGFDRPVVGNASGTAETVSDVTAGLALSVPVALDVFDVGFSKELAEDLTVYLETLSFNGALNTAAKYLVQRPIPRVYSQEPPEIVNVSTAYQSFYSGHVSATVSALTATSMTYTLRHGASVWPWLFTAAVSGSVATERLLAGRHFYTDVIVGLIAGAGVGYLVPKLHELKKEQPSWSVIPLSSQGFGLAVMHQF